MTERQAPTVHSIRLIGPWEYAWVNGPRGDAGRNEADVEAGAGDKPSVLLPGNRVRMPSTWREAFGNVAGTVRFRRRFHQPTNLDSDERVRVRIPEVGGTCRAWLGELELSPVAEDTGPGLLFDVTEWLKPACELTVEVTFNPAEDDGPGGLPRAAVLEIGPALPQHSGSSSIKRS